MAEIVTIVNRSTKTLRGVWDGKHYILAPGKHEFSRTMAEKFKAQNPVMGTENKYTGEMQYLIGILEDNDDVTPIEPTTSITRKPIEATQQVVESRAGGLYAHERQSPVAVMGGPVEGSFVKP